MSATLRFEVTGIDRIVSELDRRYARTDREIRGLFDSSGLAMMEQTSELSPYDTGFMSSKVTYTPFGTGAGIENDGFVMSTGGPVGFTVGWHERDFAAEALPFYPVFQEFGTIHHPAQPSLGPVARQALPVLKREAGTTLRTSMGGR